MAKFRTTTLALLAAISTAGAAFGQAEPNFEPPRTETDRPDFQGVWSNASVTRMTRPRGYPLVLNAEQAAELEGGSLFNKRSATENGPINPEEGAPEAGRALPPVGNYDVAWTDPGSKVASINGELRSSFIVYPEDGQIPELTATGQAFRKATPRRRGTGYDHPEERGLSERCIVIGTAGPPLGQYLYNNNVQIVQTGDNLVIMTEMIHDARIIRINGEHRQDTVAPWMGDSIGWWEGDTLVIETTNLNEGQRTGQILLSDTGKVIERISRISDSQLLYEFEINDPETYTEVWRAEAPLNLMEEQIYEYACHEGNYGLENILAGGRQNDRQGLAHTGGEDRGE